MKQRPNDELSIDEALAVTRNDAADLFSHVKACEVLYRHCDNYSKIHYLDLIHCLRRGDEGSYFAARALNIRSGRKVDADIRIDDLVLDQKWWIDFLVSEGLLIRNRP